MQIESQSGDNQEGEIRKELPPYIISVGCRITGNGKMRYHVEFGTKDTQITDWEFTIFLEDSSGAEIGKVPLTRGQMAGDLEADIDWNGTYYLTVAPTASPDRRSKEILALHSRYFRVKSLAFTENPEFKVNYRCDDILPSQITVMLDGKTKEGATLSRALALRPFEREMSLEDCGFESVDPIEVTVSASYQDHDAKVELYSDSSFHVANRLPVVERVEYDGNELRVRLKDALYEETKLTAEVYGGGRLCYLSEEELPSSEETGVYIIPLPAESIPTGLTEGFEIRFRVWAAGVLSAASAPHRLILGVPEAVSADFVTDGATNAVKIGFCGQSGYPHSFVLSGLTLPVEPQRESHRDIEYLTIPFQGEETVQAAYRSGVSRGPFSEAVSLKMDQYYLFQDGEIVGICRSLSPVLQKDMDITVDASGITIKDSIGGNGVFTLEEGALTITGDVWSLKSGRDKVRMAYNAFLAEMETAGCTPADIRTVRRLIGSYLPQTMEEFAFYNYYFDNSFPKLKSTIELFSGLILEASYSIWQYVGDTGGAEYLNGGVASGTESRVVVEREEGMCLDPFLPHLGGGDYVDLMKQPSGINSGGGEETYMTAGGAAFIDWGAEKLRRPFALLAYHSKFPRGDSFVNPVMSRNVALLAAQRYEDLRLGRDYFFENDTTDVPGLEGRGFNGGYLRGRVQITPCVRISVCGMFRQVPIFTTVGDIAAEYGLSGRHVSVKRDGILVTGGEWIFNLPVYMGDEIRVG